MSSGNLTAVLNRLSQALEGRAGEETPDRELPRGRPMLVSDPEWKTRQGRRGHTARLKCGPGCVALLDELQTIANDHATRGLTIGRHILPALVAYAWKEDHLG